MKPILELKTSLAVNSRPRTYASTPCRLHSLAGMFESICKVGQHLDHRDILEIGLHGGRAAHEAILISAQTSGLHRGQTS